MSHTPDPSRTTTKSVSMTEGMYDAAVLRQKAFGLPTFSDYIRTLIQADLQRRRRAFFTIIEEELEAEKDDRNHRIDMLQAELQWQKDPTRRAQLITDLRHMQGEPAPYPSPSPAAAPHALNESESEIAKKRRHIRKKQEN